MDDDTGTPFPLRGFAIALFVGLVVGIERERRQRGKPDLGGVRTFPLISLVGAVSAWLTKVLGTPWIFVVGVGGVAAAVVLGHALHGGPRARGLTTEVAAIAVCLLGGASVLGHPELAVALAIVVSALLAFKASLHGLVGRIGQEDLYAALKLLLVAFVVLPHLPDRTVDPWDAVNPRKMGWLVVVVSTLSFLGYVAVRILGAEKGLLASGVLGGLVSSTAVTLGLARRSREGAAPALNDTLAAAILLAWTVSCARVLVVASVVNVQFVPRIAFPVGAMGVAALVGAALYFLRGRSERGSADAVALKNPFSLWEATKFALFFTAVVLLVAVVRKELAPEAVYVVAALAGATDVDAITLSMARLEGTDAASAALAVVIAAMSNTVAKTGIAWYSGARALGMRLTLAAAAMVGAGGAVALLS